MIERALLAIGALSSILVAADAAVDDRVREALEAVVESEDDVAIEKALRRLP